MLIFLHGNTLISQTKISAMGFIVDPCVWFVAWKTDASLETLLVLWRTFPSERIICFLATNYHQYLSIFLFFFLNFTYKHYSEHHESLKLWSNTVQWKSDCTVLQQVDLSVLFNSESWLNFSSLFLQLREPAHWTMCWC